MSFIVRPGVPMMAASLLAAGLLSGCASTQPVRVTAVHDAFAPQLPMRYTLQAPQLVTDTARNDITRALLEAGLQPASAGQSADMVVSLGYGTREQSVGVAADCEAGADSGTHWGAHSGNGPSVVGNGTDAATAGTCGTPGRSQPWFGAKRYLHVLTLGLTQASDGTLRYRVTADRIDQDPDGAAALPVLLTCALHPFPRTSALKAAVC